ncbi:type IX secretion system protein PorD [Algoriphagus namhaensis]
MKRILLVGILLFLGEISWAQELNFTVTINAERSRIQNTDVFNQMQASFEQFLNGRSWTDDEFRPEERIRGNMLITINDVPQVGSYNATVQVQVLRPIYGTNYESLIFNFADRNWNFQYLDSQPLEFNRFTYLNNITSLLAYYAHIALGIDYDTFESRGGDPFFEVANDIVNNAQQSGRTGWGQSNTDRRNRYWLINDIYISSVYGKIRDAYYLYHRQGMDILLVDQEKAYGNILEAIRILAEANKTQPNGIFTISFMDAKSDEIAQVLKNASFEIRSEAVELLLEVDPNNARKYNDLLES